jgi:hypothetical protein
MNKTNQMHNSLKIIKSLLYSYSVLHVSGTLAPIISNLLILHIQPPVTMCRWVGCIFHLWCVTNVAKATVVTHQSWKSSIQWIKMFQFCVLVTMSLVFITQLTNSL